MMQIPPKFPSGLAKGATVVTNARYARVYPKCSPGRRGEIEAACNAPNYFIVRLEGQTYGHSLHRNFFDIVDSSFPTTSQTVARLSG